MGKREKNHDSIMKAIIWSFPDYEVLDKDNSKKNLALHVRIPGKGDVWPTTGSARFGDRWIKRDVGAVLVALGAVDINTGEVVIGQEKDLQERVAEIEKDLSVLAGKVEMLSKSKGAQEYD